MGQGHGGPFCPPGGEREEGNEHVKGQQPQSGGAQCPRSNNNKAGLREMGPNTLERLVGDPSGKIWLEAPGESTWRGTLHPLLLGALSQREQSPRRAPVARLFPGSTHPASSRPLLLSAPGSGHPRPPSLLSPAGLALQVSVCSGLHLPRMLVWLFWGSSPWLWGFLRPLRCCFHQLSLLGPR